MYSCTLWLVYTCQRDSGHTRGDSDSGCKGRVKSDFSHCLLPIDIEKKSKQLIKT